jgi:predicted Zn finger-like uncharacterized protein
MLVSCNSCQKKFTVPDSAITENGRLLQCGSCGNKWKQFPIRSEPTKKDKLIKEIPKFTKTKLNQIPKIKKIKKAVKKKKREINLYSEEYLKKKHGLVIKESLAIKNVGSQKSKITNFSSNFFNYLIIAVVVVIAFFAILNLTKDILVEHYPFTESYIYTLYEVLEIFKSSISSLIN